MIGLAVVAGSFLTIVAGYCRLGFKQEETVPSRQGGLGHNMPRRFTHPEAEAPSPASWFRLRDTAAISGIVRSEVGQPLPEVTVRLAAIGEPALASTETANDGSFSFADISARRVLVTASKPTYREASLALNLDAVDSAPGHDSAPRIEIELALCEEQLEGTVEDEQGMPVQAALISAMEVIDFPVHARAAGYRVSSGSDGRFSLCAPENRLGDYEISKPGFGTRLIPYRILAQLPRVQLRRAGEVSIAVWDDDGKQVRDALCGLTHRYDATGFALVRSRWMSEDGTCRYAEVDPGVQIATAFHPLHGSTSGMVVVHSGQASEVILRMTSRVRVSGTITVDGHPAADEMLRIDGCDSLSASEQDGSFELFCSRSPLPRAVQTGHVGRIGHAAKHPASLVITEPIDGLAIEMTSAVRVPGVVTQGGRPVRGATVRVGESGNEAPPVTTDHSGKFELRLRPREYMFTATSADGQFVAVLNHVVTASPAPLHFALRRAGSIRGKVVDVDGHPVAEVRVMLWPPTLSPTPVPQKRSTGLRGEFAFEQIELGTYRLDCARCGGLAELFSGVTIDELSPDAYRILTTDLRQHRIAGRVAYDDGLPASFASVRVGDDAEVSANLHGAFAIDARCGDSCRVEAITLFGERGDRMVERPAMEAVLIIVPRVGRLEGELVGATGEHQVIARTSGSLLPTRAETWSTGGRFAFDALPPGQYRIMTDDDSYAGEATVRVDAGKTAFVQIAIEPTAYVDGRVVFAASGAPAGGAFCMSSGWTVVADASGGFATKAPAARSFVHCSSGMRMGGSPLLASAGTVTEVEVALVDRTGDAGLVLLPQARDLVAHVAPSGSAARAGIADGDVVIEIDGVDIAQVDLLTVGSYISTRPPGAMLRLKIRRPSQVFDNVEVRVE